MSTNYYLRKPIGDICKHCGNANEYEELHIGKYSHGWRFLFDHNEVDSLRSFKGWQKLLEKHPDNIYDEYGKCISLYELYSIIDNSMRHKNVLYEEIDEDYFNFDDMGYRFSKVSGFC